MKKGGITQSNLGLFSKKKKNLGLCKRVFRFGSDQVPDFWVFGSGTCHGGSGSGSDTLFFFFFFYETGVITIQ